MAKEPGAKLPVEGIPSVSGTVSAIAGAHAPSLYFEAAPAFGYVNGVVQVTLHQVPPSIRRDPGH
jgi:hypothetical protein